MHFLTKLQNTEVSVTSLKSDSTADALTAIFIFLIFILEQTNK